MRGARELLRATTSYGSIEACVDAQLDGCVAVFTGASWESGTLSFDAIAAAEVRAVRWCVGELRVGAL